MMAGEKYEVRRGNKKVGKSASKLSIAESVADEFAVAQPGTWFHVVMVRKDGSQVAISSFCFPRK